MGLRGASEVLRSVSGHHRGLYGASETLNKVSSGSRDHPERLRGFSEGPSDRGGDSRGSRGCSRWSQDHSGSSHGHLRGSQGHSREFRGVPGDLRGVSRVFLVFEII